MGWELFSLETLQELARQYGYGAVFFGIALENAGIPIPGETITLVGGFLAGSGDLGYSGVLLAAIAGAVLGDSCGYWVGRWGGWPLLVKAGQVFNIPAEHLDTARDRFSQNAAGAVFFGRFVTLLRIFAGPMAGIARMPYAKFLLYNIGGASIWATIMVTLAYFLGRVVSLEQIITWVSQFGAVSLLAVFCIFILYTVIKWQQTKTHKKTV
ncbi:MAG: DedA family protein [Synechocystis sp.]|jgi:membrane protein DedA with SNARE-associated domain